MYSFVKNGKRAEAMKNILTLDVIFFYFLRNRVAISITASLPHCLTASLLNGTGEHTFNMD